MHTTVIPALGRLGQEDPDFKASLGYTVRPCFKKTPHTTKVRFQLQKSTSPFKERNFKKHSVSLAHFHITRTNPANSTYFSF
jgi:hypothetical protein